MKKIPTIIISSIILFSCNKKNDSGCTPVLPDVEASQMANFCNSNGITYTADSNGIFYQVIAQGTGASPNMNSTITVTYITSTLDGTIVDDKSTTPVTGRLSDFNEGWRITLPHIQEGGHIKMVLPSSLAYGCTGINGLIAPNSPLYYDVFLASVQ